MGALIIVMRHECLIDGYAGEIKNDSISHYFLSWQRLGAVRYQPHGQGFECICWFIKKEIDNRVVDISP